MAHKLGTSTSVSSMFRSLTHRPRKERPTTFAARQSAGTMNEPSDFLTDANLAQLLDAARKHFELRVGSAAPPPQDVLENEEEGGRSLIVGSPPPLPPLPRLPPKEEEMELPAARSLSYRKISLNRLL